MSHTTLTPRKARRMDAASEHLLDLRHEREALDARTDDAILSARRDGLTFDEIGYALGISQTTAIRYYRRRLVRDETAVTA